MPTPTFWVEPTGMVRRWLRRYGGTCPATTRVDGDGQTRTFEHGSMGRLDDVVAQYGRHDGHLSLLNDTSLDTIPADHPAWTAPCTACGAEFESDGEDDDVFIMELYTRPGSHDAWVNRAIGDDRVDGADPLPPGGMFDAWWEHDWRSGPDGLSLVVILPTGHGWHVDHRASNCGLPDDDVHRCWIRHGDPRTEPVTVDKNGQTCVAGGGSIAVDGYHGFLQAGYLTDG